MNSKFHPGHASCTFVVNFLSARLSTGAGGSLSPDLRAALSLPRDPNQRCMRPTGGTSESSQQVGDTAPSCRCLLKLPPNTSAETQRAPPPTGARLEFANGSVMAKRDLNLRKSPFLFLFSFLATELLLVFVHLNHLGLRAWDWVKFPASAPVPWAVPLSERCLQSVSRLQLGWVMAAREQLYHPLDTPHPCLVLQLP